MSQINFDHFRIVLDVLHQPRKEFAPVQHGNLAMSSTNFMSCSMTSTERSLMMRLSSSAVLARSLTLMPATIC